MFRHAGEAQARTQALERELLVLTAVEAGQREELLHAVEQRRGLEDRHEARRLQTLCDVARPAPSPSLCFVPGSPHVVRSS